MITRYRIFKDRKAACAAALLVLLLVLFFIPATGASAASKCATPPAPASAKARAVIDLTGYWVSIVDEDWVWRMMTPAKGDFTSVPLNAEGKKVTNAWDPAKDEAEGNQCRAYGAGGIMRIPERLHITWVDDNTLEMDIDAGMQKRLFHFDGSKWRGGDPQWQGDSVAVWEKQIQRRSNGAPFGGPEPGKGGNLHVITTHMRPGYIEKNGIPYSGNAVLNEHFRVLDVNGAPDVSDSDVRDSGSHLFGGHLRSEQPVQTRAGRLQVGPHSVSPVMASYAARDIGPECAECRESIDCNFAGKEKPRCA